MGIQIKKLQKTHTLAHDKATFYKETYLVIVVKKFYFTSNKKILFFNFFFLLHRHEIISQHMNVNLFSSKNICLSYSRHATFIPYLHSFFFNDKCHLPPHFAPLHTQRPIFISPSSFISRVGGIMIQPDSLSHDHHFLFFHKLDFRTAK